MSQQKLTDREQADAVDLDAQIHVVQDGVSQRATIEQVKDALDISIALNDLSDVTVSATDPATADGTFWVDIS